MLITPLAMELSICSVADRWGWPMFFRIRVGAVYLKMKDEFS